MLDIVVLFINTAYTAYSEAIFYKSYYYLGSYENSSI